MSTVVTTYLVPLGVRRPVTRTRDLKQRPQCPSRSDPPEQKSGEPLCESDIDTTYPVSLGVRRTSSRSHDVVGVTTRTPLTKVPYTCRQDDDPKVSTTDTIDGVRSPRVRNHSFVNLRETGTVWEGSRDVVVRDPVSSGTHDLTTQVSRNTTTLGGTLTPSYSRLENPTPLRP